MDVPSSQAGQDAPVVPEPPGELIVHNGRLSGTRRALNPTATIIGRAEGCDIRLNADGVYPIHCVLVAGPQGLFLRAPQGCYGTWVNGEPFAEGHLADGVLLAIGPFQFRVSLAQNTGQEIVELNKTLQAALTALEEERDALRIQAAAVVAQQAAVTEEEYQVRQRQIALESQEAQLASRLEEQRHQLLNMQKDIRQARTVLREERAAHEKRLTEATAQLARQRRELAAAQKQIHTFRSRLTQLFRRLKRRYARQRQLLETSHQRRQGDLDERQRQLDGDQAHFIAFYLRANGDIELGRRQLQDSEKSFQQSREQRQRQFEQAQADLDCRTQELSQREATLRKEEKIRAAQQRLWEERKLHLEREREGLENRIRHLRQKVVEQQDPWRSGKECRRLPENYREDILERPGSLSITAPPLMLTWQGSGQTGNPDNSTRLEELDRIAGDLTDQRLHLLEQCERLARVRQEWQADQTETFACLETVAQGLDQRERQMAFREQTLAQVEADLRRRQEVIARVQSGLEGWQARLTVCEAAWETERETTLARIHAREEAIQSKTQALTRLRQRWMERRRQERETLQSERDRYGQAQRQFAGLWEEYLNRFAILEQEQRALGEKSLALEQYRQEFLAQSANSKAVDKRLERLRRRWVAQTTAATRRLTQERRLLIEEAHRVNALVGRLQEDAATLSQREGAFTQQLTEGEKEQVQREEERLRIETEVQSLRLQDELKERQLQSLRDEVERLARHLLGEEPVLLPFEKAA